MVLLNETEVSTGRERARSHTFHESLMLMGAGGTHDALPLAEELLKLVAVGRGKSFCFVCCSF